MLWHTGHRRYGMVGTERTGFRVDLKPWPPILPILVPPARPHLTIMIRDEQVQMIWATGQGLNWCYLVEDVHVRLVVIDREPRAPATTVVVLPTRQHFTVKADLEQIQVLLSPRHSFYGCSLVENGFSMNLEPVSPWLRALIVADDEVHVCGVWIPAMVIDKMDCTPLQA